MSNQDTIARLEDQLAASQRLAGEQMQRAEKAEAQRAAELEALEAAIAKLDAALAAGKE